MYIISTFDHSKYLEMGISAIQLKGIKKESILAVPMDRNIEAHTMFDSIHKSDGISFLDVPALLAVFFGIFGSIYGFILAWGPLFWGLIGIAIGIIFGILIKLFTTKKYWSHNKRLRGTEVVLIIECEESQSEMVKDILWTHHAFGVSKLDLNSKKDKVK